MWGIAEYCIPGTKTKTGLASIFCLKYIGDNINAICSGQYHIKCGENREYKIFQSAKNHRIRNRNGYSSNRRHPVYFL